MPPHQATRATSLLLTALLGFAWGCTQGDPYADLEFEELGGTGGPSDPADPDDGKGDEASDAGGEGTTGGNADDGAPGDGSGDGSGSDEGGVPTCLPTPTRLIVLGDSIFACFGVGGKSARTCAAKRFHDHLRETVGAVSYENLAVNGAVTRDVAQNQLGNINVGQPGHAIILVFIGGNDLAPFIFQSDAATENGYGNLRPSLDDYWADIFAFSQDPAKFPDGATVLMNTQYNPFDECTADPYATMTPLKNELLAGFNEDLIDKAQAEPNAYIVDQFPSYLGHGHHFDKMMCPHYMPGAQGWMFDLIHPNEAGHANLARQLAARSDELFVECEPR